MLSLLNFHVRRDTVAGLLGSDEIAVLVEQDLIREFLDQSGDSIFVVRLPELLAGELANRALAQIRNNENPAEWLSKSSRLLPLGDIIAAEAILDSAARMGELPIEVLLWFINNPPTEKPVVPGMAGRMFFPGVGSVNVDFRRTDKFISRQAANGFASTRTTTISAQ